MERYLDEEIKRLRAEILKMGILVQEAIGLSIKALETSNLEQAQAVIDNDPKIDELELIIDEICIDLIARYQPVARDLRYIATGLKVNNELERIADLAGDIAQRVLELKQKTLLKPIIDIPKLSLIAQYMVRDTIDSFLKKDVDLAKKVVLSDLEADHLKDCIQNELVQDYMLKDAKTVDRGVPLLLIARHLERICDHASNIAEDVIYMVEGRIVRHHKEIL